MTDSVKYLLDETRIPRRWYNLMADLPSPPPPGLHPGALKRVGPDDLAPLFPMELIKQEVSREREIDIPEPVRDVYRQWRPSPLYRARRLEKALDTPAHIYYKHEGVSPVGSHKPNTAVAQAFYNKEAGTKALTTETGAGQWGSALAGDPGSPGSLGIAISEAVEAAATSKGAKKYALGSVLNHVLLHQTVIGEETLKQLELAGEDPDAGIGRI